MQEPLTSPAHVSLMTQIHSHFVAYFSVSSSIYSVRKSHRNVPSRKWPLQILVSILQDLWLLDCDFQDLSLHLKISLTLLFQLHSVCSCTRAYFTWMVRTWLNTSYGTSNVWPSARPHFFCLFWTSFLFCKPLTIGTVKLLQQTLLVVIYIYLSPYR